MTGGLGNSAFDRSSRVDVLDVLDVERDARKADVVDGLNGGAVGFQAASTRPSCR